MKRTKRELEPKEKHIHGLRTNTKNIARLGDPIFRANIYHRAACE